MTIFQSDFRPTETHRYIDVERNKTITVEIERKASDELIAARMIVGNRGENAGAGEASIVWHGGAGILKFRGYWLASDFWIASLPVLIPFRAVVVTKMG